MSLLKFCWVIVLFTFLACCWPQFVGAQSFPCDGTLYLTQSTSTSTTFYKVNPDDPVTFTNILSANAYLNSVGYNPLDNYIYGLHPTDGIVYRIDASGNATNLGVPSGMPAGWKNAGDINDYGEYVISGDNGRIIVIDLKQNPIKLVSNEPMTFASGPGTPLFADLVFHPSTGKL